MYFSDSTLYILAGTIFAGLSLFSLTILMALGKTRNRLVLYRIKEKQHQKEMSTLEQTVDRLRNERASSLRKTGIFRPGYPPCKPPSRNPQNKSQCRKKSS